MKLKTLTHLMPKNLFNKFSDFESNFKYPFANYKKFIIKHPNHYNAFYQSIGDQAVTLYLEKENKIIGTISIAIKQYNLSSEKKVKIAYIGDLKILEKYQNSRALLKLFKATSIFLKQNANLAYYISMDPPENPNKYKKGLKISAFKAKEKRYILLFDCTFNANEIFYFKDLGELEAWEKFKFLSDNKSLIHTKNYTLKSSIKPIWLSDELAIGRLEDTRQAKQLYWEDGEEILSSHLSYFAFLGAESAKKTITQALKHSREKGFSSMFLSLNNTQYDKLKNTIECIPHKLATATVYSTEPLPQNFPTNTSEI